MNAETREKIARTLYDYSTGTIDEFDNACSLTRQKYTRMAEAAIAALELTEESWTELPSKHPFEHCEITYSGEGLGSVTWNSPAGPVDLTKNYREWFATLPVYSRWVTPTTVKERDSDV